MHMYRERQTGECNRGGGAKKTSKPFRLKHITDGREYRYQRPPR